MTLNFTLVICTYERPKALYKLLSSVKTQSLYPNGILIIDGSTDDETKDLLINIPFKNLKYYKVSDEDRGLTRQRNFGIKLLDKKTQIVCFLDDDIVLTNNYFEELIYTYKTSEDALAVGGYILENNNWVQEPQGKDPHKFYFDGWSRKEPLRFKARKWFGLLPDEDPGFLPSFSHGRSIGFLPPSGKTYPVEQIMGGVSSYKKEVFDTIEFSNYFEGYGLYEDADFSLRLAKLGKLYVNSNARLYHYHDDSGRPNKYRYGKMVVRNGWYIWRVKYPNPNFKARLKWNATSLLLTIIRFLNVINTEKKQEAFTESFGRVAGWFSLILNKPKLQK